MRPMPAGMREKVLAAAELIADHGLDATKMEDIAAATGVPKATLYYYFDGKEDILAFLFNEILDEVARAVDAALRTDGTAADRLRVAIVAHLRIFEAFPAASRALQFDLGRAARIPHIDERIEAAYRRPIRRAARRRRRRRQPPRRRAPPARRRRHPRRRDDGGHQRPHARAAPLGRRGRRRGRRLRPRRGVVVTARRRRWRVGHRRSRRRRAAGAGPRGRRVGPRRRRRRRAATSPRRSRSTRRRPPRSSASGAPTS